MWFFTLFVCLYIFFKNILLYRTKLPCLYAFPRHIHHWWSRHVRRLLKDTPLPFIYEGDSKVPGMQTITTPKFSQSILIFKILSCKRAIRGELKKQRRRRCVYVSKASSSLFVDYINRKKKNGWKDAGIDGQSDERVHRWSGFEVFPFLKARPIAERYREVSSRSILELPTSNHHQTPTTHAFLE